MKEQFTWFKLHESIKLLLRFPRVLYKKGV
jgi:hypothetical protein